MQVVSYNDFSLQSIVEIATMNIMFKMLDLQYTVQHQPKQQKTYWTQTSSKIDT